MVKSERPTREDVDAVDFKFTMLAEGWKEKLVEPTDQHDSAPDEKAKLLVISVKHGVYFNLFRVGFTMLKTTSLLQGFLSSLQVESKCSLYKAAAVLLVQSALTIVQEKDKMPST